MTRALVHGLFYSNVSNLLNNFTKNHAEELFMLTVELWDDKWLIPDIALCDDL